MAIDIGDIGGDLADAGDFGDFVGEIHLDIILDWIVDIIVDRVGFIVERVDVVVDEQITQVAARHNLAPSSKELQAVRRAVVTRVRKRH